MRELCCCSLEGCFTSLFISKKSCWAPFSAKLFLLALPYFSEPLTHILTDVSLSDTGRTSLPKKIIQLGFGTTKSYSGRLQSLLQSPKLSCAKLSLLGLRCKEDLLTYCLWHASEISSLLEATKEPKKHSDQVWMSGHTAFLIRRITIAISGLMEWKCI